MRLGDAQNILRVEVDIDLLREDIVLLKEPGLYCVLLPRQVQKLVSAIEEKDNQIQAHQQKILKLNKEIDDLIKNSMWHVVDILTRYCASSKKIAKRPFHIRLFDVKMMS